jgi:hypothetical protein
MVTEDEEIPMEPPDKGGNDQKISTEIEHTR